MLQAIKRPSSVTAGGVSGPAPEASGTAPPRGRTRPGRRPGRLRSRFLRLLSALAALAGVFCLFAAGPAGAQSVPPDRPQNVKVTAGNAKLTLTWQAPSSWGSGPARGYEIDWSSGSSAPALASPEWQRVDRHRQFAASSTATGFTFSGNVYDYVNGRHSHHSVANGTRYHLRIRAASTNPDDNTDILPSHWVTVSGTPQAAQSSNANLSGLTAGTATSSGGTYTSLNIGTFAATTTAYTASVANARTHLKLTPTVADTGKATVTVQGASVTSGSASGPIALDVGSNTVTARVTAEDGTTTRDYTVTVTREAAPPGAPTRLLVSAGDARLDLSWTAPSDNGGSALTGYDVHYTASDTVAANAAAGSDAATEWVAQSRGAEANPPAASQAIPGLTNDTPYRVRVRARNAAAAGGWAHGAGTPQQTDTTGPAAPAFVPGDDTAGPAAPAFVPGDGTTTADAGTTITLTFAEAVRKDGSNADFTGHADLSAILTLARTNAGGAAIAYTASINAEKTVITIDPTGDLADGAVYVGISSAYYDANGNAGTAASATFTVAAAPAQSSNANLSGLTASSRTSSGGTFNALTLSPAFATTTTAYTATVANARMHLKLTPTVADTGKATVTVQGASVTSGSTTAAIALDVGSNAVTVRVTAEDGTTTNYTVTVTRRALAVAIGDRLQRMWLARFGRTVGSRMTDAVSERLAGGLAPGARATLAGQPLALSHAGERRRLGVRGGLGRSVTGRELMLGSSFDVAAGDDGSGPAFAAWGRVAQERFDGVEASDGGRANIDGEVLTGTLGADADWGRVLAGVAVSLSEGEGGFDRPGDRGSIESTLTTVNPYARVRVTERLSAWGLAGWGTGDMAIRFDDGGAAPVRTDIGMRLGALGARGALMEQDGAGGMDLALKTDAFFVRMEADKTAGSAAATADASRVRLALEGGRTFALSETAVLRPRLQLGVRHDDGDAETGTGVELGGGVAWADAASGLSVEVRARMLAAHADSDYEEWGAGATARLDPGEHGRGLSLSLAPVIGSAASASERVWGAHDARGLAPAGSGFEASRGLTAEVGYGLGLYGDRFTGTPNLGFGMSDGGARDWRLGWRFSSERLRSLSLGIEATRREPANDNGAGKAEHGVILTGALCW